MADLAIKTKLFMIRLWELKNIFEEVEKKRDTTKR